MKKFIMCKQERCINDAELFDDIIQTKVKNAGLKKSYFDPKINSTVFECKEKPRDFLLHDIKFVEVS